MATVSDNFNGMTAGDKLSAAANWDSNKGGSQDRLTADNHNDTSDGTIVLDGSGTMAAGPELAVHTTALDGPDHTSTARVFPDSDGSIGGNRAGVVARSGANGGNDCYAARFNTATADVELIKWVGNVPTVLGTPWGFTPSTSTVYDLTLRCDGTTIEVVVDGTTRISVTDSSITTGNHAGLYFERARATVNGQPWLDNFTASDVAASGITGSGTPTDTRDTQSASGTFTPPQVTGSGTPTDTTDTASASGTHSAPAFTGSAAVTDSTDTGSASGTFAAPVYTATGATTDDLDTGSGTGTFVVPVVTGSGTPTDDLDTANGSATFTAPVYTATGTPADSIDTGSGSATFTAPEGTGVGSPTDSTDTMVASGTFVAGTLTGSGTPTDTTDTASGSATFTPAAVTGSGTPSDSIDTATSSATFTAPAFTATGALSDSVDTATASATFTAPVFTGTATVTDERDTMRSNFAVPYAGSLRAASITVQLETVSVQVPLKPVSITQPLVVLSGGPS